MTDRSSAGQSEHVVELRTYLVHPGERAEYDRIFREEAGPLLQEFGIDVVAHGPSLLDDDHYFLLRAYGSMAERDAAEERFYGSAAWHDGPREAVISRIVSYHEIVLPATAECVEGLRSALRRSSAEG